VSKNKASKFPEEEEKKQKYQTNEKPKNITMCRNQQGKGKLGVPCERPQSQPDVLGTLGVPGGKIHGKGGVWKKKKKQPEKNRNPS